MSLLDEVIAEARKPIPCTPAEFEGGIAVFLKQWEFDHDFSNATTATNTPAQVDLAAMHKWLDSFIRNKSEYNGPLTVVEEAGIHYVLNERGNTTAIYGPKSWAAIQAYCQKQEITQTEPK